MILIFYIDIRSYYQTFYKKVLTFVNFSEISNNIEIFKPYIIDSKKRYE